MKIFKRQSGQSLVEFALIFPIVFFLITGFIDLGRAVFFYSSLSNAVREATRFAIVHKDALDDAVNNPSSCTGNMLQNKVLEYAFALTDMPDSLQYCDIDVSVTKDAVFDYYETVTVTVQYMFKPITPGITAIIGGNIPLDVKSTMYVSPAAR